MSQVTISIPTPLRVYTNNEKKVNIENVKEVNVALLRLIDRFPSLKEHLFDNETLRDFVNIYLNDEDVRYLDESKKSNLRSGDSIAIIPAYAGGLQ